MVIYYSHHSIERNQEKLRPSNDVNSTCMDVSHVEGMQLDRKLEISVLTTH